MKTVYTLLMCIISSLCIGQSWSYEYPGSGTIDGIVEASDGYIITHSEDGTYSRINPADGQIVWTFREPVSPFFGETNTYQSLARIGNNVLAARNDNWIIFNDLTGAVTSKGTYAQSGPLSAQPTVRACRARAINGTFYIVGGFQLLIGLPYTLEAGGLIQSINPNGTVNWCRRGATMGVSGPVGWVQQGLLPTYADVELHPDGSGNLVVAGNSHFAVPGYNEAFLIRINAINGQEISIDPIWMDGGNHSKVVVTDLQVFTGFPYIGITGYAQEVTGHVGFFVSVNTQNNIPVVPVEQTVANPAGGNVYYTTMMYAPGTFERAGVITNGGTSRLFVELDDEQVTIDDSYVNEPLSGPGTNRLTGSHCVIKVGSDYYLGTRHSANDTPLLIKKEGTTPINTIACASDASITETTIPSVHLGLTPTFPPYNTLNTGTSAVNLQAGATRVPYCCNNLAINFSGDNALCGGGTGTVTANLSGAGNTYSWSATPAGLSFTANGPTVTVDHAGSNLGFYDLCLTVTTVDGCVFTDCTDFDILGPIYHTLPSVLCVDDPCVDFFTSGASSNAFTVTGPGVTSNISGPIITYSFCPNTLSPGNYTVNIVSNLNSCSESITVQVQDGQWPKTTANNSSFDRGLDLDVDQQGNVYSLGSYVTSTQLDNYNIVSPTPGTTDMLLSKVSACGEVLWVARSGIGKGNPVKLDVNHTLGLIYVTGTYSSPMTFFTGEDAGGAAVCSGGQNSITTSSTAGVYIAVYTFDGCLVEVVEYNAPAGSIYYAQAVASHEYSNGPHDQRLYLLYKERTSTNVNRLHLAALTPTFNSGALTFSVMEEWSTPFQSSQFAEGNDLVSYNDNVYFTGSFMRDMLAVGLAGANFMTGSNFQRDAFVYGIKDNGASPSLTIQRELYTANPSAHRGVGYGVTTDGTDVFVTGSYTSDVSNGFGSGLYMSSYAVNQNTETTFVLALANNGNVNWLQGISNERAVGKAITVNQTGELYISGDFRGSLLRYRSYVPSVPQIAAFTTGTNGKFVMRWDVNQGYNFPNEWANTSVEVHSQNNAAVTTFDDYVFTTGHYRGEMNMNNSAVAPILSGPSTTNLYLWRQAAGNGQAKINLEEDLTDTWQEDSELTPELSIYPNPNRGQFIVNVSGLTELTTSTLKIMDVNGREVYSTTQTGSGKKRIDLSSLEAGVYLLWLNSGDTPLSKRIIIQ